MIIDYKKGDLVQMLKNSVEGLCKPIVIAHGCNCHNTHGAGIAKSFRVFPQILGADVNCSLPPSSKLGKLSVAFIDSSTVFNLYTQYFYGKGRQVDYLALEQAFKLLDDSFATRVYIPRIGAGLGGGDWEVIEGIINKSTPNTKIIVIDYVPNFDPRV